MSKKEKKIKNNYWTRLKGTTNFYPTYIDGNNDKVNPASSSYRTEFQPVIPRYDLSMSQTRDRGTGPSFLEHSYQTPKKPLNKSNFTFKTKKSSVSKSKMILNQKKKIRTDFWH